MKCMISIQYEGLLVLKNTFLKIYLEISLKPRSQYGLKTSANNEYSMTCEQHFSRLCEENTVCKVALMFFVALQLLCIANALFL